MMKNTAPISIGRLIRQNVRVYVPNVMAKPTNNMYNDNKVCQQADADCRTQKGTSH
ncbi:hypothetical protein [Pedobacter terrae]|uniref:hypothetical protein n=1 Tax=Pedobacter terrae TaxID=405671 RepID=UPI002FFA0392